jgi:hypothetical protein
MRVGTASLTPAELDQYQFNIQSPEAETSIPGTVVFAPRPNDPANTMLVFHFPKDKNVPADVCMLTQGTVVTCEQRAADRASQNLKEFNEQVPMPRVFVATHPKESKVYQLFLECNTKVVVEKLKMLTQQAELKPYDPFLL